MFSRSIDVASHFAASVRVPLPTRRRSAAKRAAMRTSPAMRAALTRVASLTSTSRRSLLSSTRSRAASVVRGGAADGDWTAVNSLDGAYDASDAPYVVIHRVPSDNVGALSDVLLSMGASSVSTTDADLGTPHEEEIFSSNSFAEAARDEAQARVWSNCEVTAYFDTREIATEAVSTAETILGVSLDAEHATARANDWVRAVKESFKPRAIADGLYIIPNWVEDMDRDAVNIVLEPGIAFGTGEHPTTRLCLRWLKEILAKRSRTELVVDFGCGSGVLAIGALLMGAERAVGVDLARQAVQSSMDNAKLNGVHDRLTTFLGDGTDPGTPGANGQADIVVANILIGPVLELEGLFARYCKKGGEIALSGVLYGEQSDSVVARYAPHFDNLRVSEEDGWACVHGTRNAKPVANDD